MAAGIGTRLKPLTEPLPKPMVPVVNKPVMEYTVELLKQHNIREIVANTHYNPEYITDYFRDGKPFSVDLHYSYEKELLGTAGGVKNNKDFLDETFFVLSGDTLTDINLTEMYNFHKEKNSLATIALKPVQDVSQYGVVVTDENGRIRSFQEKPKVHEALSAVVNTGIYIFEPEIFDFIPDGFYDFGKNLFPRLLDAKNINFYGYITDNYWCDVGTVEVYKKAQEDVSSAKYNFNSSPPIGPRSPLGINNTLSGNIYIGHNCRIGDNVVLHNCIIWDNCIIGENAVIKDSIICSDCIIEQDSIVRDDVILGWGSRVGKNIVLENNKKIAPGSSILTGKVASA